MQTSPSSLSASRKSKCHEKPAPNRPLSSQSFRAESVAKGAAEAGRHSVSGDKHQAGGDYSFDRALAEEHEQLDDLEGSGPTVMKNRKIP